MITKIVTAPSDTPISLAEAKLHLGILDSNSDTLIGIYLSAAVKTCEQILQRKLITQTWKVFLDYWRDPIVLPFGDLQSVTHVKYTDEDGDQSTFSSDSYLVDTNPVPGLITLKSGEIWPSVTLYKISPIEIQFITGYGDDSTSVPDDIRSALLLLVAHYFENREIVNVNESGVSSVNEIPHSAKSLMSNHRIWSRIL